MGENSINNGGNLTLASKLVAPPAAENKKTEEHISVQGSITEEENIDPNLRPGSNIKTSNNGESFQVDDYAANSEWMIEAGAQIVELD